jgi:aromatic-L-amino-acid decarboxylase
MDWMAKVLGLEEPFHGSSGKGGGVIGVSIGCRAGVYLLVICHGGPFVAVTDHQNSASEVALTATIAARERALRSLARAERSRAATPLPGVDQAMDVPESVRDECTRKLVMYVSTQTHSLGTKAGKILGITCRALPVTAEDGYALRGETLRKAVQEDVKAGLTPFFVSEYRRIGDNVTSPQLLCWFVYGLGRGLIHLPGD